MNHILKVVGFNIFGLALFTFGLLNHTIQPVFANDVTHMTYVISALMALAIGLSSWDAVKGTTRFRSFLKFQIENYYLLGLAGTVIGFLLLVGVLGSAIATMGQSSGSDQLPDIMKALSEGLRTSFGPTLVGVVCWIWTRHLVYFTRPARKIFDNGRH